MRANWAEARAERERLQRTQQRPEQRARKGTEFAGHIVEHQRVADASQFGADLRQLSEQALGGRPRPREQIQRNRTRQRLVKGAQVLDPELSREQRIRAFLAEQILQRVALQNPAAEGLLQLRAIFGQPARKIMARHAERARPTQGL
jgi:hypothetical protein